jgi:hypothetical protein
MYPITDLKMRGLLGTGTASSATIRRLKDHKGPREKENIVQNVNKSISTIAFDIAYEPCWKSH